ncbi:hypothetical protein MNBD_BACTEROID05-680, partial [hydrothermal vent metagenome]
HNKTSPQYGDQFYKQIGAQTPISETTLKRIVRFYQQYPNRSMLTDLNWSHFIQLLSIKNPQIRQKLTNQAFKQKWNVKYLTKEINSYRQQEKNKNTTIAKNVKSDVDQLPINRGILNRYKLVTNTQNKGITTKLFLDEGFNIRQMFKSQTKNTFKNGDIVDKNGQKIKTSPKELYTYQSYLERVVDGDTLIVLIQLKNGSFIRQRLRLYRINTPELNTPKGEEAKQFVIKELKNCSFLIVKTYKMDKFGRFEADVFYKSEKNSPEAVAQNGLFLNQELLNNQMAVKIDGY